jgi:hypothetical protein
MARAYLAEAKLPKRYWFWATREALSRMNLLPRRNGPDPDEQGEFKAFPADDPPEPIAHARLAHTPLSFDAVPTAAPPAAPPDTSPTKRTRRSKRSSLEKQAETLTTPYAQMHGQEPDWRILFAWGSTGYFRQTIESSGAKRTNFSSQTRAGIALGRSDYTNGIMFWDPTTSRFSVSADYRLDSARALEDPFPELKYDGCFHGSLLSGTEPPKEPFPPGAKAFALVDGEVYEGIIVDIPLGPQTWYRFLPEGSPDPINIAPCDLASPDDPMLPVDRHLSSSTEFPRLPSWIANDSQITLIADLHRRQGNLLLDGQGLWTFVQRDRTGRAQYTHDLSDLPTTWRSRILDGSLELGWPSPPRAFHVSAAHLQQGVPNSFRQSMRPHYKDKSTWTESYIEEHTGLVDHDTYDTITESIWHSKYPNVPVLPSMVVQTVKPDEFGNPIRAKSRIVALGNYEDTPWTKSDKYAPVIRKESCRLLTSMAIGLGRTQKQGDCKNAFCHPLLPENEKVIVRPPAGCPLSAPGELWLLKKTLYGLCRSPKHWFNKFKSAMTNIGLKACPHDPCVFTGVLVAGQPPIYLGVYVDDFTYFSESDEVERAFELALDKELQVEFMGDVAWFLGCSYVWQRTDDGRLTVSVTQTAKIESMQEEFGMADCNANATPFRSGAAIDRIPHDGVDPYDKPEIIKPYQRLVGGLNWLSLNTRPEITVLVSLLSSHLHNASAGHLDAAKYVLSWLGGTRNHGIRFTQGGKFAEGLISWADRDAEFDTSLSQNWTDANWGPQDASHPNPARPQTIVKEEVRSILGHCVTRMNGPIAWGCMREKRTSRSSCEAEIKSMDEGCKTLENLHLLMEDLGLPDVTTRPNGQPLYNDNKGAIEWSHGCNISKKLRHLNIREMAVRDALEAKMVDIKHVPGHSNIADLMTKEFKGNDTFRTLAFQLLSTRDKGGCYVESGIPVTVGYDPAGAASAAAA